MLEGETEETCREHIKVMKREMARPSNSNLATITELMALTHAYRRELFFKETIPINQFIALHEKTHLPSFATEVNM